VLGVEFGELASCGHAFTIVANQIFGFPTPKTIKFLAVVMEL
jgi:hypothetical protein